MRLRRSRSSSRRYFSRRGHAPLPKGAAVGQRADAQKPPEMQAHRDCRTEAASQGDLIDREVCFLEQLAGERQALVEQPMQWRHTDFCPEPPGEGPTADSRLTCHVDRTDRVGKVPSSPLARSFKTDV